MDHAMIKRESIKWEGQEKGQEQFQEDDDEESFNQTMEEDDNSNGGMGSGPGGGGGLLDFDTSTWNDEELAAYQALKSKRKKCAVSGCTSRSIPIAKSYHQLPVRNAEVWQHWVEAIRWSKNDPEWLPQQDQPLVCSRHFDDTCFIKYEGSSRMRLTHTAIPTLYLDPPHGAESMDARFEDPNRPLPDFVPNLKVRERPSQAKNVGGGGQKKVTRNGVANNNNPGSRVKAENKEVLEVTPELPTLDEYSDDYYNNDNGGSYYQEEGDGSSEDMQYDESSDHLLMQQQQHHQQQSEYDDVEDGGYEDEMSSYLQPEVVMQQQQQQQKKFTPQLPIQTSSKRSMPTLKPCPRAPKLEPAVRKIPAPVRTTQIQQQPQRLIMARRPQPGSSSGIPQIKKPVPVSNPIHSRPNMNVVQHQPPPVAQRRTMLKMKVTNPGNGISSGGGGSQKLKIGVTKCRMIVERIEQYLEEVIRQTSQEMDVPVQVVRGIWQVKDRIKQGNNNHAQN